jgi:transglutaminase-like putative cysteine protease
LLVALLRANNIPAGLCYQRLTVEGEVPPYCLHGLAAVHLDAYGWCRIDPRGNKPGVDAQFTPPIEKLAFPIVVNGEMDLPEIWQESLSVVTSILKGSNSGEFVADNLPDIELLTVTTC